VQIAINEATTMNASFREDIAAYAAAGFEAVELWLDKVAKYAEKNSLEDARRLLTDNGVEAVGACFHAGIMLTDGQDRSGALDALKRKLEICQALGAPTLIVCPDGPGEELKAAHYDAAAEGLAEAADIALGYDVSLGIEFIQGHPFVGTAVTAAEMADKTGRDNVGVLFDTFHFYVGASKVVNIQQVADRVSFVHLNDCRKMPVELAQDSDRTFPGEGMFPLPRILGELQAGGYDGYISLELFDQDVWDMSAQQAADLCYEKCRTFTGAL
jgi:sugar phosphate isomerase/epimerase